jgi:hypothetical protein
LVIEYIKNANAHIMINSTNSTHRDSLVANE